MTDYWHKLKLHLKLVRPPKPALWTALFILSWPFVALGQPCQSSADRHAYHIFSEVWGANTFRQPIAHSGWTFTLLKAEHGWHLRLYDQGGTDLTQITPPYRFGPNHRDIMGWHLRNADNTAGNDGSVNAPQTKRQFFFARSLTGTGGFRPPADGTPPPEALGSDGRGWLNIVDYGLADLEKGQQARLVYMKFSACLTWPKSAEEMAAEADFASPTYLAEEHQRMAACGLKAPYELSAYVKPRLLEGDMDGDDSLDLLAPIIRTADGKRGLAICRAGTWLDILGMDGTVGTELQAGYFDQMESWALWPADRLPQQLSGKTRGDVLMVERVEKSRYFIYRDDDGYQSHRAY